MTRGSTSALLRNPNSGKIHRGVAETRRVGCARRADVRATYELVALVQASPVEWAIGWQLLAAGVRPRLLCASCFQGGFINEYARRWNELGESR